MSNQSPLTQSTTYINVMELLVANEVDRQLQALPARLTQYLKRDEIETFALNRLPALYAASEQGLQYQHVRAQKEYETQIAQAVRQALAAVQGDPLRATQPLHVESSHQQAEAALSLLRQWMKTPDLTWDTALATLAELQLQRAQNSSIAPARRSPTTVLQTPQTVTHDGEKYSQKASDLNSTALRPGVYGCRTRWIPHQRRVQTWNSSTTAPQQ